jgi:hypothetical protein
MSAGVQTGAGPVVFYAPAICTNCGAVFRSDVPIAEPPWITPTYRATGGRCPRCGRRGSIPTWVYRFHHVVSQSIEDASDEQRRSQVRAVEQHLRRHRTVKKTQTFIQDFRGPWRPLIMELRSTPPRQRSAQLTFLLWMLDED